MDEETKALFKKNLIQCIVITALAVAVVLYMWNQAKKDDERMAASANTVTEETVSENN